MRRTADVAFADADPDGAPRHARLFVAFLLAMVVLSSSTSQNLWPFSSWNLFSGVRTNQQVGWDAIAVDGSGGEHRVAVAALLPGARTAGAVLATFGRSSRRDRAAVCADWMDRTQAALGIDVRSIRIDELTWHLGATADETAPSPGRRAVWVCTADGARAAH